MQMQLFSSLCEIGSASLEILWLPLLLWTFMALLLTLLLRYFENSHSAFQYHGRIALLIALPAGILFSYLSNWLNSLVTAGSPLPSKFIVIQSPVSVTETGASAAINWFEPAFLTALVTFMLVAVSFVLLLRFAINYIALSRFAGNLEKESLVEYSGISSSNRELAQQLKDKVKIAFNEDSEVPFTFGNREPVIVIPRELRYSDAGKLNMVIRHELMHIRQRDYLVNTIGMIVRALFWFHPLVHRLYKGIKHYREISCDVLVLTDSGISRKDYARLLFELAPAKTFKNLSAVSMSVESSNLKKRIQIMNQQEHRPNLFKSSFYSMLATALLVAGIMGCSDIQDSGITNKDVEEVQRSLAGEDSARQPLYVVDGEIIDSQSAKEKISRIKPEYIESVTVLKGDKARTTYGDRGQNGVIEIELIDKEKAFNDLLASAPEKVEKSFNPKEDYFIVVEEMPELVGGLSGLMNKMNYPKEAIEAGVEGRVLVQFIVNKEGEVENAKVVKGIGYGADEEALRVVRQAKFEPGQQQGKPVRVQYSLPVIFKLQKDSAG